MIVGCEQSAEARSGIDSLLLAARRGDSWVSVGSVGTGFKANAEYLRKTLDKLKRNRSCRSRARITCSRCRR